MYIANFSNSGHARSTGVRAVGGFTSPKLRRDLATIFSPAKGRGKKEAIFGNMFNTRIEIRQIRCPTAKNTLSIDEAIFVI